MLLLFHALRFMAKSTVYLRAQLQKLRRTGSNGIKIDVLIYMNAIVLPRPTYPASSYTGILEAFPCGRSKSEKEINLIFLVKNILGDTSNVSIPDKSIAVFFMRLFWQISNLDQNKSTK